MTITKLYTEILEDVVQAQYNAYVFSQNLGEQVKDNLFPIPVAEVREITLDVKYAYAPARLAEEEVTELSLPDLFNNLKPLFIQTISKARKLLVDEIDLSDNSADPGWLTVKKNIMQGRLDDYTFKVLQQQFFNDAKKITPGNTINQPILQQLLIKIVEDTFVLHPDIKKYVRNLPVMKQVAATVESEWQNKQAQLKQAVEAALRKKPPDVDIIVDAEELKKLPPDAIQYARVVLDVRTIINDKEKQS